MAGIDPRFYYLTLGLLAACTVVGLIVAYRLQKDVQEHDVPPTEKEVLGPLESAYYSGLMTREEFERIKKSMGKKRDSLDETIAEDLADMKSKKQPKKLAQATEIEPEVDVEEPDTEEDLAP